MSQEFLPDDRESDRCASESDRPNDDSATESEQDVLLLTILTIASVIGKLCGCKHTRLTFQLQLATMT
jgi:hypothetical protein